MLCSARGASARARSSGARGAAALSRENPPVDEGLLRLSAEFAKIRSPPLARRPGDRSYRPPSSPAPRVTPSDAPRPSRADSHLRASPFEVLVASPRRVPASRSRRRLGPARAARLYPSTRHGGDDVVHVDAPPIARGVARGGRRARAMRAISRARRFVRGEERVVVVVVVDDDAGAGASRVLDRDGSLVARPRPETPVAAIDAPRRPRRANRRV